MSMCRVVATSEDNPILECDGAGGVGAMFDGEGGVRCGPCVML